MFTDINVTIHMYDCPLLGGEMHWDWIQSNISASYWRLYWNKAPGAFVKIGDTEQELTPDSVFLMSPGTAYSTRAVSEVEHFYVHFSVGAPLDCVASALFQLRGHRLLALASGALAAFFADRYSWRTVIAVKTLVMSALLELRDDVVPQLKQFDTRIQQALNLLDAGSNISNRELARQAGMSLNSFLILFQRETGLPPQEWFRRKRLEQACKRLHFSEASIEEIAETAGFCDRYHFSKAFKKAYAIGPAEYRQQVRLLRDAGKVQRGK